MPPKKKPRRAAVEKSFFPGDPRFSIALSAHAEDVQALQENKYLSTNLLDYLIQRGAPSPTPPLLPSQDEDISVPPLYIGVLAATFFIEKANELVLESTSRKSLEIIRTSLKRYKATTLARGSKLVVPMVHKSHFFVLVIELTGRHGCEFYKGIEYYDLMDFCSAPTTRTRGAASHIRAFLAEFHKFALYFVCDDKFKIGRPQTQVKHCPCPTQDNVIDCGLFSIGVVLHIIDSIPITNETFKQEHMTKLRSDLATHLGAVENLSKYPLPCSVIRGCFPALLTMDDTYDGSIVVLGVSKNAEDSANGESSTTEVEVIMDGKETTNDVSANVAESSAAFACNVIEGIVDGNVATKESAAKDATQSPGMLKLLMEMISPASRAMKKCGGKILRFEEGEEKKNDTEKKKVAGGIVIVQAKTDSQSMQSEGQEQQGCQQPLRAHNKMNTDTKEHVEDVVFSKLVKELKIDVRLQSLSGRLMRIMNCYRLW